MAFYVWWWHIAHAVKKFNYTAQKFVIYLENDIINQKTTFYKFSPFIICKWHSKIVFAVKTGFCRVHNTVNPVSIIKSDLVQYLVQIYNINTIIQFNYEIKV